MNDDTSELFTPEVHGYRLNKLELLNWGTFDSLGGELHSVNPNGATALLVGQNGCGKSTLVDALLTLLVRPVVRNYNVAAGANKTERDEKTYIKGAYGRLGRDDDLKAEVKYLRPDGKHFSGILACFRNSTGQAFTLAQVLHLNGDGQAEKLYCFSQGERSLTELLSKLSSERIKSQVEKRGFKATGNYTEYYGWLQKQTFIRQRAMDMFNQTVAVKDVQSLDKFIRDHMLEPSKWNQKIDALQLHFRELSEAHQSLVRVREQERLLIPVVRAGDTYEAKFQERVRAERLHDACDSFFKAEALLVLRPECTQKRLDLEQLEAATRVIEEETFRNSESIHSIRTEIETAGGARLKEIPHFIKQEEIYLTQKRQEEAKYQSTLHALGIRTQVRDQKAFEGVRAQVPGFQRTLSETKVLAEERLTARQLDRADANRELVELKHELQGLEQRHGNLPEWLSEIRHQICRDLKLPVKDLPFAAELIAVKASERPWEASIELLLKGFAQSLLVKDEYYRLVTDYVDRSRLQDSRGRGQRLVYLRVGGASSSRTRPAPHAQSLVRKLDYKPDHLLVPWVKGEVEERFDYLCCESIEEFQQHQGSAVTKNRHVKSRGNRHEKDDRDRASHPSEFVLGWDNAEKRRHLAAAILELQRHLETLEGDIQAIKQQLKLIGEREVRIQDLLRFGGFEEIDFWRHEAEVSRLQEEKKSLEENNESVKVLKARLGEAEALDKELRGRRDAAMTQAFVLRQEIQKVETMLSAFERDLADREASGDLERHRESFPEIERLLPEPISAASVGGLRLSMPEILFEQVKRLGQELGPLQSELSDAMLKYLKAFDEETDLRGAPEYLLSFRKLLENIQRDDLPRHEKRFKERLNERVTQEIGLLHGELQNERNEIESKIELLNQCLKQLDFRPGTFMRLEPRLVRDVEIVAFQESLRECISNSFDGSFEADEERYLKIEKLLTKLRDEERWRDKVTDVRRWFSFVAKELDRATGEQRNYFQDSAGQSGGEKAKLAFTILVAALAYQYDIDPTRPQSDRFQFVVVDEMFSKVDDQHSEYALNLFKRFGLQLLIVAPLDSKARVTEAHVGCYLQVVKDLDTSKSRIYSMTAQEFEETVVNGQAGSALAVG